MVSQEPSAELRLLATLVALALLAVPVAAQLAPELQRPEVPLGLDLYMPVPDDNPLTREKVTLGRRLFSDTILSRDRSVACVTSIDGSLLAGRGRPAPNYG